MHTAWHACKKALPSDMLRSAAQTVRFSQSFEREDSMDWDSGGGGLRRAGSARPPLAPSGGSVSLAAQHFCPVCGIIATSQANLEV